MSIKPKILIQVDSDQQASTFDSVVAIDSGVEHLLVHSGVTEENVEAFIHGAIFTRGLDNLKSTAIFFGGSNVHAVETLVAKAKATFFGPMRVSIMADPNGANTTAVAAVLSAMNHIEIAGSEVTVLAATGPVGRRIVELIATNDTQGAATTINVCSRKLSQAQKVCDQVRASAQNARLIPTETSSPAMLLSSVCNAHAVFAAGAAGIELLSDGWQSVSKLQVAIDLNGVPPAGITGIGATDNPAKHGAIACYGAIGIGQLKMKIHKKCIKLLFESNEHTLELDEIFAIGKTIH